MSNKRIVFKLNRSGVKELLRGEGVHKMISKHVDVIQNRCGTGYGHEVKIGKNRVVGYVRAETFKAVRSNAKHNTLLKAVR